MELDLSSCLAAVPGSILCEEVHSGRARIAARKGIVIAFD